MPRKPLIKSDQFPYHVTARSNNKENFFLSKKKLWKIFERQLNFIIDQEDVKVHAFVLMDNHFHLLLTTPKANIDKVMYWFMKKSTIEIQRKSGRINKVFGGRYKGSIITSKLYLYNVYKYIALNPVRANICDKAESYQYSTFYYLKKNLQTKFKLEPSIKIKDYNAKDFWSWLNQGYDRINEESIRKGLRRTSFCFTQNRKTRLEQCPKTPNFI